MVALTKNQARALSPSFSVKELDQNVLHAGAEQQQQQQQQQQQNKENLSISMTPPLWLEMEPESSTAAITDNRDMPVSSSSSSSSSSSQVTTTSSATVTTEARLSNKNSKNKNNKQTRLVTFCEDVQVRPIPALTQQEKHDMFYDKQDKKSAKLDVKRLVTYHRSSAHNHYFFSTDREYATRTPQDSEMMIPVAVDERTKIGLEAHIHPQFKISIRKRMTKLVLQHQHWHQQHPNFFDISFLSENCTTVAKTATLMAQERAQNIVRELKRETAQEAPSIHNITVNNNKSNNNNNSNNKRDLNELKKVEQDQDYSFSVRILCSSSERMLSNNANNANANVTTAPAIEAVVATTSTAVVTKESSSSSSSSHASMEAPGHSCMVR
ncbi:unnamed protein product [Cylindrotheca closterium]|uniref:Uncharacterized protein n=1 Tax=Cylindrotheca closterium TaxID=2856 RepID=A0AAD2FNN4_9STRA|nr:unnamed protein product [Cylindrotheca closterium]